MFAALLDRQYEGVATKGNTVHIPGVVAPAIKDYKANNRTTSADAITDTGVDLLIDQEKNFDFKVDDIDAAQSAGSLAPYTDAAGKALVDDADKFIATMLAAEPPTCRAPLRTPGTRHSTSSRLLVWP
ncbi:hypothetical protein [Gordonia westfalica]|uniref:Uncharacterized protein n=1 Tax=Gordonia westfalica TaxID=158898 RepID=A0A1H2DZQ3_9ACTN|nr:hypothetical protein [Gordonia westfalica]SDT88362.1 hypothetical protein SAMN04488548_1269 [Gordonia westfalica]